MTKAKATLSLDPRTYEKAKRTYDSVSERVEELLESDLDASKIDDIEVLKEKKEENNQKIEDIDEKIKELKLEKEQFESENIAIDNKIERIKTRKDEKQDELNRFKEVFRKKHKEARDWLEPEDIQDYWPEELEKSKEELWEIGKEYLE